jgi:hypothetical protein
MKYQDAAAFRQALEQRLKTQAGGDGARLARDRKRIVFGRLLARLLAVAPKRWLLKGGFALDLRLADRARATKDVDIDWQAEEEELLEAVIEASNYDAGDFFVFSIERAGAPPDRLGGSHRFRVSASLAARPFERFLLDVGFRGGETPPIEMLETPDLLAFAGIEPIAVEAIPLELHVAEKLHAYTRTYESGRSSSRAKDLVDLVLIAELARLDAASLRAAIDLTFTRRDIHPPPETLPAPPSNWISQFRQLAEAVGIAGELSAGHASAAAFLEPILRDEVKRGTWHPLRRLWVTGTR